MGTIKITLETLYDILRTEKKMGDLQKLEYSFFLDVINYLKEKQALLERRNAGSELFAAGERQKLEYELRSIKRIVKEIYEKREKKIIDIALNKSRTNSDIIDTSAMLPEEKGLYSLFLETLDFFRESILFNLFKGELPKVTDLPKVTAMRKIAGEPSAFSMFEAKLETQPEMKQAAGEDNVVGRAVNSEKTGRVESPQKTDDEEEKPKRKVRFIRPMPSFVWKDMKVYGPFDAGEETDIFPEVAELLVRKGRAEMV
ncbi:MAG: hypothetical protein AB1668_05285 [Nanoarchaeota archaeon]